MCKIAVDIPEAVLFDKCLTQIKAEKMVKKAVALYCYVHMDVSIGYCAEIAGMTEEEFMRFLGENKVSVFRFDSEEEFLEELKNAEDYYSTSSI